MGIEECISVAGQGKCTPRSETGVDAVLASLAGKQHGVVGRWQLRRLGIPSGVAEGKLVRGSLHRIHQGVYAVGHRVLSREGRWLAAVLAFGPDAVLSHRSAGQVWGLVPRYAIAPEVTRAERVRGRPGIVVHRSAIPGDERTVEDGIPVTSVPRTVLDLAAVLSLRELERAWNEMEVRELRDPLSVPDLIARHPGRRGVANLRLLLGGEEPGGITRNDFEEAFVALLDRHGLPRGRMNADLSLRGRFIEVDCLWQRQRLAVELDGGPVHRTRKAFQSDRQRDRVLVAEGWRTMRVTWHQLRDEPNAIAEDLSTALGDPGRRVVRRS